jgi:hypothetical protein
MSRARNRQRPQARGRLQRARPHWPEGCPSFRACSAEPPGRRGARSLACGPRQRLRPIAPEEEIKTILEEIGQARTEKALAAAAAVRRLRPKRRLSNCAGRQKPSWLPDNENGVFEITGLAKEFKSVSTLKRKITFSEPLSHVADPTQVPSNRLVAKPR